MPTHGGAKRCSVELERAAVALELAGDDLDQRRFARAVATQKCVDLNGLLAGTVAQPWSRTAQGGFWRTSLDRAVTRKVG